MGSDLRVWNFLLVSRKKEDFDKLHSLLESIQDFPCILDWDPNNLFPLDLLRSRQYALVFVKYDIGVNNGINFIDEMRRTGLTTPIILITDWFLPRLRDEALFAGANTLIHSRDIRADTIEKLLCEYIEELDC